MLPKKWRISRKEFGSILSRGKRYNSPHLLLYVMRNDNSDVQKNSRFSFSVSKKVSKKAVDRNKLRRQGYSVVSSNLIKIKPGYTSFFSFKKCGIPLNFSDLQKEILNLLSVSGVIE